MKVEIVARETIKPSSPTANHLQNFKISLLDQVAIKEYTPVIYFYPANGDTATADHHAQNIQLLKTSLSKTLTKYYPFAGRLRGPNTIKCNDDGVEFVEARVDCALFDILQQLDTQKLQKLLPIVVESVAIATGSTFLLVQVNLFECGGMAISICISHKVADGVSFYTFVKSWASIARDSNEAVNPQLFIGPNLFPSQDCELPQSYQFPRSKCALRRFILSSSDISALKAKVASTSVPIPTKVEAVTALLWKSSIAASRSVRGYSALSMGNSVINIRRRFSPPLSEYTVGNFLAPVFTRMINIEKQNDVDMQTLVRELRKMFQDYKVNEGEKTSDETSEGKTESKDYVHVFGVSSLRGMPVYEADFGWGKPIWVMLMKLLYPNLAFIRDTRDDDGLEVLICLSDEDMAAFECNEELLEFATLKPNILEDSSYCRERISRL